jgi:hypothetical protein
MYFRRVRPGCLGILQEFKTDLYTERATETPDSAIGWSAVVKHENLIVPKLGKDGTDEAPDIIRGYEPA